MSRRRDMMRAAEERQAFEMLATQTAAEDAAMRAAARKLIGVAVELGVGGDEQAARDTLRLAHRARNTEAIGELEARLRRIDAEIIDAIKRDADYAAMRRLKWRRRLTVRGLRALRDPRRAVSRG